MTDLMIATTAPLDLSADLRALHEEAADYLEAAHAPNTLRAYRCDWRHFSDWCQAQGRSPMPATPETVALYLTQLARDYAPTTIQRRIASITQAHLAAGFEEPPTRTAIVRKTWRGIRRTKIQAPVGSKPILTKDLGVMIAHLRPGTVQAARDRCLLLIGFAGAMRRSELVGLDVSDIEQIEAGLVVKIRKSKTDQEGKGEEIGLPYGSHLQTCPVRAYAAWRAVSKIEQGAIFRPLSRCGRILDGRLTGNSVAIIVKKALRAAGRDADQFAGHSLRSGFATTAGEAGVPERDIMAQTRHKSSDMVRRYIKRGSLFRSNAAASVGL